jgi:hypothetical protein
VEYRSELTFVFMKSKNQQSQLFLKKHSDDQVHLLFPKLRFCFAYGIDQDENSPQWVG